MKYNILLVDDDAGIRFVLSKALGKAGFNVQATDNPQTLMKWVEKGDGDVVLTDVHMDADNIFSFIPSIKARRPNLPIVIMSANTSVMTALKSASADIFEYIPKPFELEYVQNTLHRALGKRNAPKQPQRKALVQPMIGKSVSMQPVFQAISNYMSGHIPVYIYGDVGTGKNHTARVLHKAGERSERPFVYFNTIEVFDDLIGQLNNGTLFIDRVGELSKDRQALLLQAMEHNETRAVPDRFCIISAANISPSAVQKENCIRPDLFFHLMGGDIALPPLCERNDDVLALAFHFLNEAEPNRQRRLTQGAQATLKAHNWLGNVRELRRLMQIVVLKYSDSLVTMDVLTSLLNVPVASMTSSSNAPSRLSDIRSAGRALLQSSKATDQMPYSAALAWVEKPLIEEALRLTGGNNLKAAELLGIHRNTLRTKIKSLNIVL